jgi:hypothetical protein
MSSRNTSLLLAGLAGLAGLALLASAAAVAGPETCQAQSPDSQVQLIELFTSEGCSSCPPADRWLSTLKGRPQVLAAAFHVDYWDRLGWRDRFSDPAFTARQKAWVRREAGRFAYTPQVLVNGRDWRGWPTLPLQAAPARVRIELQRGAAQAVQARVTPLAGAPTRLALWWASLEDGHRSLVRAGENSGAQLHHDHVVRHYGELPAWPALTGTAQRWTLEAGGPGAEKAESGHKARFLVVVTDALSGVPLQAAQLDCPAAG